ncbi:MAG: thermonuclease family protein [Saprospiraceae bacterium]|nr:thermonuclease family protein [Pyrinomonadaceae bacterium]
MIEIMDGKTVVIELPSGNLTAVIQYIEIPEPEQPLNQVVKEHLSKLVLGKLVDFHPLGFSPKKTVGQLYLKGLDIGQQMVRDGAAWHAPVNKTGQTDAQSQLYETNEAQAKAEKRGIWSMPGLKPAWQFRSDRDETLRRAERVTSTGTSEKVYEARPESKRPSIAAAKTRPGMWSDSNPKLKNAAALLNGYNAQTRMGYIATPPLGITEATEVEHKTAVDITYLYKEDEKKGRKGVYVVGVVSISKEWRFLKFNDLIVTVDDKKIVVGKAKRTTLTEGSLVRERLSYEISRETIEKIANGNDVVIKVGNYIIRPYPWMHVILYNMLEAS